DFPCCRVVTDLLIRHLLIAPVNAADPLPQGKLISANSCSGAVAARAAATAQCRTKVEHGQSNAAQAAEHKGIPTGNVTGQFGKITVPYVSRIFDLVDLPLEPYPLREQQDQAERHPAYRKNCDPVAPKATYKIVHGSS